MTIPARLRPLLTLAAVGPTLHGCDPGAVPEPTGSTRVDSAGVEIVTTRIDDSAPICAPQGEPLRIGSVDDEETAVFNSHAAVRLPDGRIAVAQNGDIGVTLFSAEGERLSHIGRRGQGPGELKDLRGVWFRPPDTLVVLDMRPARFHLFLTDGTWVRTATLDPVVFETPEFVVPLGAGRGFVSSTQPASFPDPPDPYDRVPTVAHHDESGAVIDTLGVFRASRMVWTDPENRYLNTPVFGARGAMVRGEDGSVAYGSGLESQIEILDLDGTLRRIIRWDARDRTVRPADVEAFAADLRRRFEESGMPSDQIERALRRETGDHRPVAERFPGHGAVLSTPEGRLWVEDYRRPLDEGPTSWFVFESDGTFACRVSLPDDWFPRSVDSDHVVAWTFDDLQVEYVMVQAVGPPEGSPP